MKLDVLKHLELCSDCQEKVNKAYFSMEIEYDLRQKPNGIYYIDYQDATGKRHRPSLKTRDRAIADKLAEEFEFNTGDYDNLGKYEQSKGEGVPYHINERKGSKSGILYMCWFDGKKSHWKSLRTNNMELAGKVAESMWEQI